MAPASTGHEQRDQERSDPGQPGAKNTPSEEERNTDHPNPAAENIAVEELVVEEPRENPIPNREEIGQWLKDSIINQRKGLQKMYGETESVLDEALQAPIEKGEEMARKLIMEMGCPYEVAKDLTVLTLYDVAILIGIFRLWYPFLGACFAYSWVDG